MKLSISLAIAAVILRFTTPGPGSFRVVEWHGPYHAEVIASGHETNACHWSVSVDRAADMGIYHVEFFHDEN